MRVEVKSTQTTTKSGTSAKGKPYSIVEQEAWAHCNGEFRRLRVSLRDGASAYPIGEYSVAESSFVINQFGNLEIGRLELVKVAAQRAA